MDSNNMERLIRNLGCSYEALIDNELIVGLPLQSLYDDDNSLEIEPAPGVELVFWAETLRFEVIHITITDDQQHGLSIFEGSLPEPYSAIADQASARKILGEPIVSKTAMELQGTGLSGWDTYQLDTKLHPAALIDLQYTNRLCVVKIQFSLIDKNV